MFMCHSVVSVNGITVYMLSNCYSANICLQCQAQIQCIFLYSFCLLHFKFRNWEVLQPFCIIIGIIDLKPTYFLLSF